MLEAIPACTLQIRTVGILADTLQQNLEALKAFDERQSLRYQALLEEFNNLLRDYDSLITDYRTLKDELEATIDSL